MAKEVKADVAPQSEGTPKSNRKFEVIISGAEFHDFEAAPMVTGVFIKSVLREQDLKEPDGSVKEGNAKGDIMGFLFLDEETKEETIVGNSHQIKKGLELAKAGDVFRVTFKGQTQNAKNQKVNIFRVEKAI